MTGPAAGTPPDPARGERQAQASLSFLRTLLLLCVLVPAALYAAFASYRYQQVHAEAEVRLDRALRIAHEHALKVLETNDVLLRSVLDLTEGDAAASLAPSYFLRFHADLSANEPGLAITMFREDGVVYSRWPALATAPPRMARTSPVLARVLAGEDQGVIRGFSSLDRQDRLILFRRVGAYPLYLGTGLELGAIRAGWLREMAFLGAFAAVPVLGLLVAALMAMRRARQALDSARRLREESAARQQVEEALRQSQKMEAVGRLTGGVAHDFNNALMVIAANLHVLKKTQPGIATRQTEAIARAVDSATKLTRQLLAFSRRQALTPQVLRLQERLPQLKDLVSPVLGSQVTVAIEVDPGTAPVQADLAELELALLNLAVNARDAMPGGGSFRIEARNGAAPDAADGPVVVIGAVDSGSGIPPELQQWVFEPFFTTKPVGEGTGLGLSQVYGFCQRSGGVARIRSTPGQGTTVEMVLPAYTGPVEAAPAEEDMAVAPLDLRILLVEDNAEVAAAVRPVLESLGCTVTHFDRAAPALQWLQQGARAVDAVLTDVVMPGEMDGLTLAQQVRTRHPGLGLVVMTGYAAQLEEITRQGFTVLAKPWSPANLARALREAIRTVSPR